LGHSGLYYSYYTNPQISDVSPLQVPVDQSLLVTVTSTSAHTFNSCNIIFKPSPSLTTPLAIVGSNVVHTNAFLDAEIVCRFGRFGATSGALIDYDQIGCPTPNTRMDQSEISSESVDFEISINGQDFIKYSKPFKFVGTKTATQSSSSSWMILLLFGSATFFFILFVIAKSFDPSNGRNGNKKAFAKEDLSEQSVDNNTTQRKNSHFEIKSNLFLEPIVA